jgi:hypothetical protein
MFVFTVNLLNTHESERSKPNWVPFAWMPIYDPKLAPGRPGKGFESHTARAARLEHQALSYVFANWDERTQDAVELCWGGSTLRKSRFFLAAVVVDHPQLDRFAGAGECNLMPHILTCITMY